MIKIRPSQYRFISAIVATIFWLLIWKNVLVKEPAGWFSACSNCWGDWMAHLAYTTVFAYGHNWPPELPVYSGHKFTYPFAVDLLSAALVKAGLDLPESLVWPGLILSLGLTYLIYRLGETLGGSSRAGVLTVVLFLFNGAWSRDSRWLNFITSQLIPQRGILLGLSLSIIIYLLLWRKKNAAAGIVAGLLPLIHAHSYLVTLLAGAFSGWKFLLPAAALGLPQIVYFYGLSGKQSFFAVDLFWLNEWRQLWPVLLIMVWGLVAAPKKLKKFSLAFWLVFLAANFFRFQPWAWDNSKFFLHWYLIAAVGAASLAVRRPLIGLVLILGLIIPGGLDVSRLIRNENKYQFFSRQQLTVAAAAREILPADTVVLTAPNHNHWLPALTGRKIFMGYPGWLWTYGIDYSPRQAETEAIYRGDGEILTRYPIEYVVIGPDEKAAWPGLNQNYFTANFPLVFDQNGYKIFQVR